MAPVMKIAAPECTSRPIRELSKSLLVSAPQGNLDSEKAGDKAQDHSQPHVHIFKPWSFNQQSVQTTWKIPTTLFLITIAIIAVLTGDWCFPETTKFYRQTTSSPPTAAYLKGKASTTFETDDYQQSTVVTSVVRALEYPRQASSSSSPSGNAVLDVFQVYQPVLTPYGPLDDIITSNGQSDTSIIETTTQSESCTVVLMEHVFAYSYGIPFVGTYNPPSCKFNRVVMNLTVTSRGRQFDRLAIMYFGDSEVFRTSTAEPTANGIEWTYFKDMSEYMFFWNQSQTLIFDLGNLIDSTYTGTFNTTLTATFFTDEDAVTPAAIILPISARKGAESQASLFTLPAQNATNTITLPRNVNRAVFTISACGQATEEFWWSNVFSSDANTFADTTGALYGYSPFREVQVYIDGLLAGVQWPFPVIFTGGVVPGLWRPIVGIDAFDLREHEIDISAWLGVLCDGAEHTFEIKVAGIADDGASSGSLTETVGSSWYVTGKIFLWVDDASSITTGGKPTRIAPTPAIELSRSITRDATGANETLTEHTNVQRALSISSTIKTQHKTFLATWSQTLTYSNDAQLTDQGDIAANTFKTTGLDVATGNTAYRSAYEYPLFCNQSYIVDPSGSGNFTLTAAINRGLTLNINTASVFPTGAEPFLHLPGISSLAEAALDDTILTTTQNGTAEYLGSPATGTATGFGSTSQKFTFVAAGAGPELYERDVTAVNGTVIYDRETLLGDVVGSYTTGKVVGGAYMDVLISGPKQAMGRGPGTLKQSLVQA